MKSKQICTMLAASLIIVIRDLVESRVETPERGAGSPAVSQSLITSPLVSMYGRHNGHIRMAGDYAISRPGHVLLPPPRLLGVLGKSSTGLCDTYLFSFEISQVNWSVDTGGCEEGPRLLSERNTTDIPGAARNYRVRI